MEIQLQELIDQIKKNGVEVAESEAEEILSRARAQAEAIVAEAQATADRILQNAKAENERMLRVSEDAIRQAGRNLLLSFRESVARELEAVTRAQVSEVYSSATFAELLSRVIQAWTANHDAEGLSVLVSADDAAHLEAMLLGAMKEKLLTGVTLRPNDQLDGGFRIAAEGGRAYYDYSKDAVVEMLSTYLGPRLTALMKEAEQA